MTIQWIFKLVMIIICIIIFIISASPFFSFGGGGGGVTLKRAVQHLLLSTCKHDVKDKNAYVNLHKQKSSATITLHLPPNNNQLKQRITNLIANGNR